MASKKEQKEKTKKGRGRRIGKGRVLLYLLCLVGLAFLLRYAVLLLLLGMLPAFVARYVDTSADGNHSRVIFTCNFAGVMPFIVDLFKKGITSDNVHTMLFDPGVWLTMYGAAAFGWGLVWFFPKAVYFLMELAQDSAVNALNAKQQQIVDEWGLEVEKTSRRALRNASFREEQKHKKEQGASS